METIKLSPRMAAVAELIPPGSSVADIGTDHGYLPVYLAQCGTYGALAASDINAGPLGNARKSAAAYDVFHKIRFVHSPGLAFAGSDGYDTIVIAGMGGELIASILRDAPWTKRNKTLILQPNSKVDVLVTFLLEAGYCLTAARLVNDTGKLYQILAASGGEGELLHTQAERLVHPLLFRTRDPLLPEYLELLIHKYAAALAGMEQSRKEQPEAERLKLLLCELKTMKKETETWQR